MKKLSCLVLVFCLVMSCISAQAATASDFQAYIETLPSEFLEAMIAMFNAELARRGEATASAANVILKSKVYKKKSPFIGAFFNCPMWDRCK